jgi:UDP-N-acetylmuramoyl-L-alanyl-D-glutamate--2,6-diaminopimelate ligase
VISDRFLAISSAIEQAGANDSIVIAGKGHENFQEIHGKKLPFSDQEVVQKSLTKWSENHENITH